jgi:hypothetical protein
LSQLVGEAAGLTARMVSVVDDDALGTTAARHGRECSGVAPHDSLNLSWKIIAEVTLTCPLQTSPSELIERRGLGMEDRDGWEETRGGAIIGKLREAEVELARGKTTGEVCRQLGVSEQTYYLYGLPSAFKDDIGRDLGRLAYLYPAS